jgi:hypothetical protein
LEICRRSGTGKSVIDRDPEEVLDSSVLWVECVGPLAMPGFPEINNQNTQSARLWMRSSHRRSD